jgi:hypothetical protein
MNRSRKKNPRKPRMTYSAVVEYCPSPRNSRASGRRSKYDVAKIEPAEKLRSINNILSKVCFLKEMANTPIMDKRLTMTTARIADKKADIICFLRYLMSFLMCEYDIKIFR